MLIGHNANRELDALFINSPLRDYDRTARTNDYTLPVLGMAYIATFAASRGFNVAVLDAEAAGNGPARAAAIANAASPRWVGVNLLAPTYEMSVRILERLDPAIMVMVGGHHAKAMPERILRDLRIPRIDALIIGEAETRVAELLADLERRSVLPQILWRDRGGDLHAGECLNPNREHWLAPDLEALPIVDRRYLANDPHAALDGRLEANLVGSRGCPFNCSFCGAARDANKDVRVRSRAPASIAQEMCELEEFQNVTAFRFVDDLFLASYPAIQACMRQFIENDFGERFVWDATGRTNILARAPDALLDDIRTGGCREVALGIESGSPRLLAYIDKQTTPEDARRAVDCLAARGIDVKGYFILGFPTETRAEMNETVALIRELRLRAEVRGGSFRASVFQFRPYPGTPEWARLIATGKYSEDELLDYHAATTDDPELTDRDEFDFSIDAQLGEVPTDVIREVVAELMREERAHRREAPRRRRPLGATVATTSSPR